MKKLRSRVGLAATKAAKVNDKYLHEWDSLT